MTTSIFPLIKGFLLMILSYIGVVIIYSDGLMIHIREGSPGWYIALILSFILLIKGLHNVYTFIRRQLRCIHLNILKQKRLKRRTHAKLNHSHRQRRTI